MDALHIPASVAGPWSDEPDAWEEEAAELSCLAGDLLRALDRVGAELIEAGAKGAKAERAIRYVARRLEVLSKDARELSETAEAE